MSWRRAHYSFRFEGCTYFWVVMSDSSKTTSPQHWSVKLPIECSAVPQCNLSRCQIWPSLVRRRGYGEGRPQLRGVCGADRFCADGNKTGKSLGGLSCGRKARNFCYCGPEDCYLPLSSDAKNAPNAKHLFSHIIQLLLCFGHSMYGVLRGVAHIGQSDSDTRIIGS